MFAIFKSFPEQLFYVHDFLLFYHGTVLVGSRSSFIGTSTITYEGNHRLFLKFEVYLWYTSFLSFKVSLTPTDYLVNVAWGDEKVFFLSLSLHFSSQ